MRRDVLQAWSQSGRPGIASGALLLTDVANRAQLRVAGAGAASYAVGRYRALVEAVSARHGSLGPVESDGETVQFAFACVSDALEAALDLVRAVRGERWPGGAVPGVRIAVHPHDGVLDRGAVLAVARPGAVVVSPAAAGIPARQLPPGCRLVGRGVPRPTGLEHVFELHHQDLAGGVAGSGPVNVPAALSSFVGREAELELVARMLADTRMLTLTGAGGSGKTRLAQQAALAAAAQHPDGVFFVELGRLDDPGLVPGALLGALGLSENPGEAPLDTAVRRLAGGRALVVLDNCEHLQDAGAEAAQELLLRCSGVRLLATSRESPLGVTGEVVWSVPGMSLPIDDTPDGLAGSDAVALFASRARQAVGQFVLDERIAPAAARICRSLDGMPLAIELAAARLRMLSATQIADGLGDRLRLLGEEARGIDARHHTLRASIDWSHDLLSERERKLLRRLSVFAGGFTLHDAEAICADSDAERGKVLELVGALVDKSLVDPERRADEVRYRLLETIRHYAAERLAGAGEAELLHDRHARHFRALADDADRLRLRPDGRGRLVVEEPNFRAALEHAVDADPETALAIAAGLSRWWIERDHYRDGRARCARALAAGSPGEHPALRSIVNWGAGMLALYQSDFAVVAESIALATAEAEAAADPRALGRAHMLASAAFACLSPVEGVRHGARAVEIVRALGDDIELAWALAALATGHAASDDYPATRAAAEECIELAEPAGDSPITAWAEWLLGTVLTFEGDLAASTWHLQRAIELIAGSTPVLQALALGSRLTANALSGAAAAVRDEGEAGLERAAATAALGEAGLRPGLCTVEFALGALEQAALVGEPGTRSGILFFEGNAHDALARVALARGDLEGARAHAAALERLGTATGNARFHAQAAYASGRAALHAGALEKARERLHHALAVQFDIGARVLAIDTLEALAAASPEWAVSMRLMAAAVAERQRLGAVRALPDAEWLERVRATARDELGAQPLAAAWEAGLGLAFTDAVAYAQRARGPRDRPLDGWDALTPTERQVARLAARGLSNPEIAHELFVSRSTVKLHLSRTYGKLGITNRHELARCAR